MKLLIVDGNSILNRAYYGVKPLSNHKGVFTNAIYGFFNILLAAVSDTAATDVVIAFDRKEKTFRHKAVASYKANRKGMPEELAMQLPYTQQILTAMGYPVITCAGWEADDILGTLSAIAEKCSTDCILLTGDRDNLQLIGPHVSVRLATNKAPILYDTAKFEEDYGFPPRNLIDLKALMGDASDNISGVSGIGEKTAMALVQQYGDIESLYAALPDAELKPAVRRKLEAGADAAKQSKWLATIVTDAPIPQELSAYARKEQDPAALSALLTELELYKLMERLDVTPAEAPAQLPDAPEIRPTEIVTLTDAEFDALCKTGETVDFLYHDGQLDLAWSQKAARIADADRIFLIHDGCLEASGTQEELLNNSPLYKSMWESHIAVRREEA